MNKKGFKEWLTDEENMTRWKKFLVDSLQEKDYVSVFFSSNNRGGSNYINVHGHQVFAKMYMYKMYKNVQNMFFPVWKFPG